MLTSVLDQEFVEVAEISLGSIIDSGNDFLLVEDLVAISQFS